MVISTRTRPSVGGRLEDRRASGSGLSLGELHGVGDLGLDVGLERLERGLGDAPFSRAVVRAE